MKAGCSLIICSPYINPSHCKRACSTPVHTIKRAGYTSQMGLISYCTHEPVLIIIPKHAYILTEAQMSSLSKVPDYIDQASLFCDNARRLFPTVLCLCSFTSSEPVLNSSEPVC